MTEDQILVDQARQGDMNAFRDLVERNKQKIYFIALDMTGNHHDAEDISQDVFIKAYRSLSRFRGDARFSSWLYRITVNHCIERSRKKSWKAVCTRENMDEKTAGLNTDCTGSEPIMDPEKYTEQSMIQLHIEKALCTLTEREKAVFILRHYHDLPLKEIARSLKVTEGTIKSTLFRALKRLQKSLSFYQQEII